MSPSGYLFNQRDRLPKVGGALVCYNLRFAILETGSHRIVRAHIERMEGVTASEAET